VANERGFRWPLITLGFLLDTSNALEVVANRGRSNVKLARDLRLREPRAV
jgi:hypothetical protein